MKMLYKISGFMDSFNLKLQKVQFLTGNTVKIIAVSLMLFDHFCKIILRWCTENIWQEMVRNGQMSVLAFIETDTFIRFKLYPIGTIAFPLFCFLLSEGFFYTKNKKNTLQ